MNNLLFGDATFGYYETICGGAGATPDRRRGRRRAHAHDQHAADRPRGDRTALSGPRAGVLDPPRLAAVPGRHRGGDGVVRRLEFLRAAGGLDPLAAPRPLSALTAWPAEPRVPLGRNILIRTDGSREQLPGHAQFQARAGDVLVIETPGGGGFGKP